MSPGRKPSRASHRIMHSNKDLGGNVLYKFSLERKIPQPKRSNISLICSFQKTPDQSTKHHLPCFSHDYQLFPFKIAEHCKPRQHLCLFKLFCKQTKQIPAMAVSFCAASCSSTKCFYSASCFINTSTTLQRMLSFHEHRANYDKDVPLFRHGLCSRG